MAASRAKGERNDCTVRAMALSTGLDYDECHAAFAAVGRIKGKGVRRDKTRAAAKRLGFEMVRTATRAKTAITIERDRALQSGNYIVGMTRHLAAMVDGKLHDHTKGRRKRVNNVWEMIKVEFTEAAPVPAGSTKWLAFTKYTKHDQINLFDDNTRSTK